MCVKRNIEAPSCHYFCSGKAISMNHSDSVFVALGIQDARRMHQMIICGLYGCKIFFSFYPINETIFEKKKVIEHEMLFRFLCKCCPKRFLF